MTQLADSDSIQQIPAVIEVMIVFITGQTQKCFKVENCLKKEKEIF